jgi:hypothetical protein
MDSMSPQEDPQGIVRAFPLGMPASADPFLLECTNDRTVDNQAGRTVMAKRFIRSSDQTKDHHLRLRSRRDHVRVPDAAVRGAADERAGHQGANRHAAIRLGSVHPFVGTVEDGTSASPTAAC